MCQSAEDWDREEWLPIQHAAVDLLKPCPFCSGPARLRAEEDGFVAWYFVRCKSCGASGTRIRFTTYNHCDCPKDYAFGIEAIEAWNTRPGEPATIPDQPQLTWAKQRTADPSSYELWIADFHKDGQYQRFDIRRYVSDGSWRIDIYPLHAGRTHNELPPDTPLLAVQLHAEAMIRTILAPLALDLGFAAPVPPSKE